jgi:16S rRNA (uracil1498-N3)-methyltransferase
MPQFFITSSDIKENRCRIAGDDFRHLASVRRVKPGDVIMLRDEEGASLEARVDRIAADHLEAIIVGKGTAPEAPVDITLCMCLLKGGNFDQAIEKAVEVGVSRIIPVSSGRTVPRPADADAKVRRWNRKAQEAAKQSLRERVPVVDGIHPFDAVIVMDNDRARIIAHPGAAMTLKQYLRGTRADAVNILVGPEGGFSPEELEAAEAAGWVAAGFGFSQLRAETAAAVLCGIIVYEWGSEEQR